MVAGVLMQEAKIPVIKKKNYFFLATREILIIFFQKHNKPFIGRQKQRKKTMTDAFASDFVNIDPRTPRLQYIVKETTDIDFLVLDAEDTQETAAHARSDESKLHAYKKVFRRAIFGEGEYLNPAMAHQKIEPEEEAKIGREGALHVRSVCRPHEPIYELMIKYLDIKQIK